MSSPPFSFFPEGARVSGCAGELLADMADRRAGMGRGCAAGDGGPPSSAAHPCPGALPQSSGSRGGEERRRGSGIGIWLGRWLAAARVLRAAERGRRGPGGDRRDVGERSGHWLPPPAAALPAALASPQRGGAAHRALLSFLLLFILLLLMCLPVPGPPWPLTPVLPAVSSSPASARLNGVPGLTTAREAQAGGVTRILLILLLAQQKEPAWARAGERAQGAGADRPEWAAQVRDREAWRGSPANTPLPHWKTCQHQKVRGRGRRECGSEREWKRVRALKEWNDKEWNTVYSLERVVFRKSRDPGDSAMHI